MDRDTFNYMEQERQRDLANHRKKVEREVNAEFSGKQYVGTPAMQQEARRKEEQRKQEIIKKKMAEADSRLKSIYYKEFGGKEQIEKNLQRQENKNQVSEHFSKRRGTNPNEKERQRQEQQRQQVEAKERKENERKANEERTAKERQAARHETTRANRQPFREGGKMGGEFNAESRDKGAKQNVPLADHISKTRQSGRGASRDVNREQNQRRDRE